MAYVKLGSKLDAIKFICYYRNLYYSNPLMNRYDINNTLETQLAWINAGYDDSVFTKYIIDTDTFTAIDPRYFCSETIPFSEFEKSIGGITVTNWSGEKIENPDIVVYKDYSKLYFEIVEGLSNPKVLYSKCGHCNHLRPFDSLTEVDNKMVCKSCLDLAQPCEICGELTLCNITVRDEFGEVDLHYMHTLCVYESDYRQCPRCNVWHLGDDEYCEKCKYQKYLHDYNYKPELKFFNIGNEPTYKNCDPMYFGLEIELEYEGYGSFSKSVYNIVKDKPYLYAKHDGSLNNGEEFVTHPMTLEYMRSTEAIESIMYDTSYNGFCSDDTCGLHVHVNRSSFGNNAITMGKMLILLESCYDDVLLFSRRSESRLDEWAQVLLTDCTEPSKVYANCAEWGRYTALNVQNSATIEFRLFAGAESTNDVYFAVEFCKGIIDYAMNHTARECHLATFTDIFGDNSDEFKHYCRTLGINL